MERNERERQMTPAERRRRMEARKRRQKERARKKRIRMLILIGGSILAVAILGLLIWGITHLISGGSKKISSKNGSFVIAIDAGHGGEDIGRSNGDAVEKNVTLDICSKLGTMLEGQGYEVITIREDDTRISKEERVQKANDSNADLLVSIHCGYIENGEASGVVSHYEEGNKQSKYLAETIQAALVKESGAADGGSQEGDFYIVSNTDMPAVLIEVGYLNNDGEAASLTDDVYQNNIAKGIAKGIIMSLKE